MQCNTTGIWRSILEWPPSLSAYQQYKLKHNYKTDIYLEGFLYNENIIKHFCLEEKVLRLCFEGLYHLSCKNASESLYYLSVLYIMF